MKYRHIACIVDGSRENGIARKRAVETALDSGSKLTFIFLASSDFVKRIAPLTKGGSDLAAGLENVGKVLLEEAVGEAAGKGVEARTKVLKGDEAAALIRELPKMGVDLLVGTAAHASLLPGLDMGDFESKIAEIREKTGVEILFCKG